jgi:hypothetical protein
MKHGPGKHEKNRGSMSPETKPSGSILTSAFVSVDALGSTLLDPTACRTDATTARGQAARRR